ncbi:hypothetical protein CYMTET_49239 [Cymbomonas tetramitiformis]|uniref:Uncharacterized protein n=1 Tax=Cymbomonas tetramitiformis TaxID=36881 RepID=A0AAE0BSK4_9CHLO|nr:hypothetical protein CYMTET_49239 [Cymbomonas tetramitiformis]
MTWSITSEDSRLWLGLVIGMALPYALRAFGGEIGKRIGNLAVRCCYHNRQQWESTQPGEDGYMRLTEEAEEKWEKYDPMKVDMECIDQITFQQAREYLALSPCEGIFVAALRLVFWHWMQPIMYTWILYSYYDLIDDLQLLLALIVLGREVTYMLFTIFDRWYRRNP